MSKISRRRDARPLEHLPRRRRRPPAALRPHRRIRAASNALNGLDGRRAAPMPSGAAAAASAWVGGRCRGASVRRLAMSCSTQRIASGDRSDQTTGSRRSPRIRESASDRRRPAGRPPSEQACAARGDEAVLARLGSRHRELRSAVRPHLHRLRHGQERGGDARPASRRGSATIRTPSCRSRPRSSGRSPGCGSRSCSAIRNWNHA